MGTAMTQILERIRKSPKMFIYPDIEDFGGVVEDKEGATKVLLYALGALAAYKDCFQLTVTYNPEWGSGIIEARFKKSLPKKFLSQLLRLETGTFGLLPVVTLAALSRETYLWAGGSFQYLEKGVPKENVLFDPVLLPRNELRVDFDLDRRVFPVFQINSFLRELRSELKGTQVCAHIQTDCDIRPGAMDPSDYNPDDDEEEELMPKYTLRNPTGDDLD